MVQGVFGVGTAIALAVHRFEDLYAIDKTRSRPAGTLHAL
jgi:hypothetical protein